MAATCLSVPKTAFIQAYSRQSKTNTTTLIIINPFVLTPKLNKELKIDICSRLMNGLNPKLPFRILKFRSIKLKKIMTLVNRSTVIKVNM